jgi:hypothetical protein
MCSAISSRSFPPPRVERQCDATAICARADERDPAGGQPCCLGNELHPLDEARPAHVGHDNRAHPAHNDPQQDYGHLATRR